MKTKENYLKAMYIIDGKEGKIPLSSLSRRMGVSIPTANSMVKRLQEEGWVIYERYKPLQLTASGKKTAALILRKHRIAEMFLFKNMGFSWEKVHDIAEEIEHIHSDALFERMNEMIGYPTTDPHGSPIPDKDGVIALRDSSRLSEIKEGIKVRLCALVNSSTDFLIYLKSKKLELGIEIIVTGIEPFDKSMTVSYGEYISVTLSKEVCERLLVEIV